MAHNHQHRQTGGSPRAQHNQGHAHQHGGAANSPLAHLRHNAQGRGAQSSPRSHTSPTKGRNEYAAPSEPFTGFDEYMSAEDVTKGLADGTLHKGRIRINAKQFRDAYVPSHGRFTRDILVSGMMARNRALEGDEVVLQFLPRAEWKPMEHEAEQAGVAIGHDLSQVPDEFLQATARVVAITESVPGRIFVGVLTPAAKGFFFTPNDSRVPRMNIAKSPVDADGKAMINEENLESTLYVARIVDWAANSLIATGAIVKLIGQAGDVDAETEAILLENGVDTAEFSAEILEDLPHIAPEETWAIPAEEFARRRDLRETCIFTIDPPTARDLDDAVSCEPLEGGGFQVGVHIADVSFFVHQNSPLDRLAATRATTTYLVQRAYPMLPRLLCENLCSLNEHVERLAFSVLWTIDENANVDESKTWFGRTVIRSCARLAYNHAQAVIENPDMDWMASDFPRITDRHTPAQVKTSISNLHKLAQIMRARRYEHGSVSIDMPKLSFKCNEATGLPESCFRYEIHESNQLIEEFMLLANKFVAKRIFDAFPDRALLRRHAKPLDRKMKEVVKLCNTYGIKVNADTSRDLEHSFRELRQTLSPLMFQAVQSLCMQPMQTALYFSTGDVDAREDFVHYALNFEFYTHFTSPIRRYADLMVHRELAAALAGEPSPLTAEFVTEQAAQCNSRKAAAGVAQDRSSDLFMNLYMQAYGPFHEDAIVVRVLDRSFDILVPAFRVETRIRFDEIAGDCAYEKRGNGKDIITIKWQASGAEQKIELFSPVRVNLAAIMHGVKINKQALLLEPKAAPQPAA